ncbi:class A beta-lactamase, subclass A2 [Spirosoma soli]|uniref:Beta-lactamase n=1 Tax=Spirosoma soli TaxID=1770529 RepID=A0ABW5M591_9BACT
MRLLILVSLYLPVVVSAQPNENRAGRRQSVSKLRNQIEQLTQRAQGRVGVAATVLETGESVTLHGDEPFPMQSVYKFPIGMAVLHQVDQGKLTLTQTIRVDKSEYVSERQHSPMRDKYPNGTEASVSDLLRYAVSESDGSASDVLLRIVGGAPVVMQYLQSLGIKDIQVVNTEKEIGSDNAVQYRNWAKPTEAVALLRVLQEGRGLSKASRTHLLRLMIESPTGPKRIKGLLPAGTVVAHKTGGSGTIDGVTAATNDVGIVTMPSGQHLAIAVFVSDAKADTATREEVIAEITKVVWDTWK